jgi:dTDP-4-dehydrorhamnose reductase
VIQAANQVGAKLVYFSTDYIFDGKNGPYKEDHPANPVCEYGRQKLYAEHLIATLAEDFLILRTTGVYGWERQGKNFIYRLMSVLGAGQTLTVPADQLGSPTYAPNFVRAVVELALTTHRQVFHVAGMEVANRYEFALEAARALKLNGDLIQPVSTAELGQTAPRPLQAGLRVEKASASLPFPLLGYHDGLREMAQVMGRAG